MKFLVSKKYLYLFAVAVLVALLGTFYFRNSGPQLELLVVNPTTFTQQISISGTVDAAQNVDLGFAANGRISRVYARVGDVLTQGSLLAETENGDLRAALAQKEAVLTSQKAQLASLVAGTRPEEVAVTQAQVASDQNALVQAHASVLNAIQNAYTQSDDAIHNKVDQFFNNPRSSSPTLSFPTSNAQLENTVESQRVVAEGMLALWQKDIALLTASDDLAAAESEAARNITAVTTLLSDANAMLNVAVPTSQVTTATLAGYIASVATARTNLNTAQTTLTSAITTQKSAATTLDKDQKTLLLEQAGSTQDTIDSQEAQVAAAQADVESAQAQLHKTLVVAPFDGTVTRMDAKVGQVISPGTSEISMISRGLFQITTYVPEVEINGLAVGNPATTTLDAYGAGTPFAASVIAIDPAETVVNGVSAYKTTLQFLKGDPRIKSGMTANVTITTRVAQDALVVPQGAVFEKNAQQVLQVKTGSAVVDVPVETSGASALGNVQITSGLSSGDAVVLNPDVTR